MMSNHLNDDPIKLNAYIKFGEMMSICYHDFERKQRSMRNSGISRGHNSITNARK